MNSGVLGQSKYRRDTPNSSLIIKKPEIPQFTDKSDDIEDYILKFQINSNQNGSNNTSASEDCGFILVKTRPRHSPPIRHSPPVRQLPLNFLSLKRDKNLRTYSRRLKTSEIKNQVSATSTVIFSNKKSAALDRTITVRHTPNFKDCSKDKIMPCNDIGVKLENNESDDTIIENIKSEVVHEEYNVQNPWASTDDNSIKNVPLLQNEIITKATEIIQLSCNRKYDNDTLNLVKAQLHQALEVLKSANETNIGLIS